MTKQLREQANLGLNLAESRYHLWTRLHRRTWQAELQKTEADIARTDAEYHYRLARLVLANTMGEPN